MGADAAIVDFATWTAVVAAGSLVIRGRGALTAALVIAVVAGGAAFAATGGGRDPRGATVSADWPAQQPHDRGTAVTVRPGDCLWDIARRRLAHPTPIRVAADWPRWWRNNRAVIGPDPDLVMPGQRLRPPAPSRSPS